LRIAFLIDRGYRLEFDLTPYRINTNTISNRRWIAILPSAKCAQFSEPLSAAVRSSAPSCFTLIIQPASQGAALA
jgi:hypothetical protein